jgi:hypothetical protein
MKKVRIIDLERKRRITVNAYISQLRCNKCNVKFPQWRVQSERRCIYCHSQLGPCEWGIRWERLKWERYFNRVKEELGLGDSFLPFIVRGKDGRFYLQFIAPSLLFSVVDTRLIPIEVEFRQ